MKKSLLTVCCLLLASPLWATAIYCPTSIGQCKQDTGCAVIHGGTQNIHWEVKKVYGNLSADHLRWNKAEAYVNGSKKAELPLCNYLYKDKNTSNFVAVDLSTASPEVKADTTVAANKWQQQKDEWYTCSFATGAKSPRQCPFDTETLK